MARQALGQLPTRCRRTDHRSYALSSSPSWPRLATSHGFDTLPTSLGLFRHASARALPVHTSSSSGAGRAPWPQKAWHKRPAAADSGTRAGRHTAPGRIRHRPCTARTAALLRRACTRRIASTHRAAPEWDCFLGEVHSCSRQLRTAQPAVRRAETLAVGLLDLGRPSSR